MGKGVALVSKTKNGLTNSIENWHGVGTRVLHKQHPLINTQKCLGAHTMCKCKLKHTAVINQPDGWNQGCATAGGLWEGVHPSEQAAQLTYYTRKHTCPLWPKLTPLPTLKIVLSFSIKLMCGQSFLCRGFFMAKTGRYLHVHQLRADWQSYYMSNTTGFTSCFGSSVLPAGLALSPAFPAGVGRRLLPTRKAVLFPFREF